MKNIVYAHEHITIDLSGVKGDLDCKMDDPQLALEELGKLSQRGVAVIIDQTARGMGRNAGYTQGLADKAGIRVLHATGFYKEPFLPPECYTMDEKAMCALFLSELRGSLDGTDISASLIGEIGTSSGAIRPIEAQIFRAAAMAHLESGAPICTHTTLGTLGEEQIAIFKEYGADLSHIVLSHIDLSGDMDYMLRLLDSGVNIAFDTVGKNNYCPDSRRIEWLNHLCGKGYAGQIVMSMDITRVSNCKELGYNYLTDSFVPSLLASGFREEWLELILCNNPKRIYKL